MHNPKHISEGVWLGLQLLLSSKQAIFFFFFFVANTSLAPQSLQGFDRFLFRVPDAAAETAQQPVTMSMRSASSFEPALTCSSHSMLNWE